MHIHDEVEMIFGAGVTLWTSLIRNIATISNLLSPRFPPSASPLHAKSNYQPLSFVYFGILTNVFDWKTDTFRKYKEERERKVAKVVDEFNRVFYTAS